jgi:glutamate 5-kinase
MGYFRDSKRIVVKVGTSTLTHSTGHLNLRRIEKLVKVLSDMKNWGNPLEYTIFSPVFSMYFIK